MSLAVNHRFSSNRLSLWLKLNSPLFSRARHTYTILMALILTQVLKHGRNITLKEGRTRLEQFTSSLFQASRTNRLNPLYNHSRFRRRFSNSNRHRRLRSRNQLLRSARDLRRNRRRSTKLIPVNNKCSQRKLKLCLGTPVRNLNHSRCKMEVLHHSRPSILQLPDPAHSLERRQRL